MDTNLVWPNTSVVENLQSWGYNSLGEYEIKQSKFQTEMLKIIPYIRYTQLKYTYFKIATTSFEIHV